jgi:hypothetical protein
MTFKINGIPFTYPPSTHHWVERNTLAFDGNGHPVYVLPRQYEMWWDWIDSAQFAQLIGFYNSVSGTNCSVDLPTWNSATGGFSTYSATLREPTYTNSFEGHYGSVKFLVLNIR